MVKNSHAREGDIRDLGSTPGSGRSPGGGQPIPVFLPGDHRGACGLHSPEGHKELDMTEVT